MNHSNKCHPGNNTCNSLPFTSWKTEFDAPWDFWNAKLKGSNFSGMNLASASAQGRYFKLIHYFSLLKFKSLWRIFDWRRVFRLAFHFFTTWGKPLNPLLNICSVNIFGDRKREFQFRLSFCLLVLRRVRLVRRWEAVVSCVFVLVGSWVVLCSKLLTTKPQQPQPQQPQ